MTHIMPDISDMKVDEPDQSQIQSEKHSAVEGGNSWGDDLLANDLFGLAAPLVKFFKEQVDPGDERSQKAHTNDFSECLGAIYQGMGHYDVISKVKREYQNPGHENFFTFRMGGSNGWDAKDALVKFQNLKIDDVELKTLSNILEDYASEFGQARQILDRTVTDTGVVVQTVGPV